MKQFCKSVLKITCVTINLCLVMACSTDFDINDLDETIFVRHKNADMPAYVKGNASEKVFLITLHGGPGDIGLGFSGEAFNQIEQQYGVVYFDQRGSGNAQGQYSKDDVSIDLMAEDVLALVKVIKHKFGSDSRFYLIGHSWGGALGTATLLKDQTDFIGWIGLDGAYSPALLYNQYIETFTSTANTQIALGNSIDFWESVLELVSKVDPVINFDDNRKLNIKAFEVERTLHDDGFIDFDDEGTEGVNTFFAYNLFTKSWNTYQIGTIIDDQGLFQTLDYTHQLSEITIPSLFISGQYDMIVPLASAQIAFESIGSESKDLLIFDRSGHAPLFSEPNRFATEVLKFMNEHK
ncbi:alpha/beta fold hydrolase [Seonamhaeicola marinus]|uniref:Alpha/beta hydrolase n=1 Tax=Seonamhaeicola marinus TaxID=1912246 RepID=A0A5D0HKV8_9FLAO|nr:alpha/beta hydrolase [Seonamhaeicola marinus]TYA71946.1 alpha/beta hydrolase [Seonamhaeicola marinus]